MWQIAEEITVRVTEEKDYFEWRIFHFVNVFWLCLNHLPVVILYVNDELDAIFIIIRTWGISLNHERPKIHKTNRTRVSTLSHYI